MGLNDLTARVEKSITKLAKKTLKKYPDTEKRIKVRIPKRKQIQEEESVEDDDAFLAELEALLGGPD